MSSEWKILVVMVIAIVLFVIVSLASYDSGYNAANLEGKIISKKLHAINSNGADSPFVLIYKIRTEKEIKEIVPKDYVYKNLHEMMKDDGETIDSAIYRWEYEFEAGETLACNGSMYVYDEGIHYLQKDLPILDTKYSVSVDDKYEANIFNELDEIIKKLKSGEKIYLTRIDVPNSMNGIYVDIRVGTPDKVRDVTFSWIAKGWATPIVQNHPGHNQALAYAKEHKMGIWGGNTDENRLDIYEGQDSTFLEIKE